MNKPILIITIDAEGDNLWKKKNNIHIKTENSKYLRRFQLLCERFSFKPVWLTNYEMAKDPIFIEFAKDIIDREKGEIGMHLHAWNSPPKYDFKNFNLYHQAYLVEFPEEIMRKKICFLTELLETTFKTKIISHRAGRWMFNSYYAKLLFELGYQVDCSVTPRVNWKNTKGIPEGSGGADYRHFPDQAYFLDLEDISKPGSSSLLEVPMSIQYKNSVWLNFIKKNFFYRFLKKDILLPVNWFRPSGNNLSKMISLAKKYFSQGSDYVEFMLHSSEFMPGGSPTFKNEAEIEKLYLDLEKLFTWLNKKTKSMTLSEFYQKKKSELDNYKFVNNKL